MPPLIFAIQVLNELPGLIGAGIDVIGLIDSANAALKKMQEDNRDPTDSEWDELDQSIEELRALRPDITN